MSLYKRIVVFVRSLVLICQLFLAPYRSNGDATKSLSHAGKDSRSIEKHRHSADDGKSSKGLFHVSILTVACMDALSHIRNLVEHY